MRRLKSASDEEQSVQSHRYHRTFKTRKLSSFEVCFFSLTYCAVAFLAAKTNSCGSDHHEQSLTLPSVAPSHGYAAIPQDGSADAALCYWREKAVSPSFLSTVALQICTGVCANSISITNQFGSLMQGKINVLKKAQFFPGLVIWTGLLQFIYNQHYSQCKGMVQHHTTRSRSGESNMSVSWETHTIVSAQTKPQQDYFCWYAVGYIVALVHSTLLHIFPPFLSHRIFLSAQKENLDKRAGVLHLQ